MRGRGIDILFSRNRKTLYMILGIMVISVFSLTIVYAALSVTLKITGNAEVVASNWNIYLNNVKVTEGSVSGTATMISNTTSVFSTTLTNPGDFFEYTVTVVNDGSIDAMIDSITKTSTLTETQAKYLNYTIEYQNGESINTKQLLQANSFVILKVRVEFRKDVIASDLPKQSEKLDLAFTVNYVQSDGSGSNVVDNGVIKAEANGDINDIGTIVTIGSEQFYTIGTDGDNVKLLSMMNITLDDKPYQDNSIAKSTVFSSSTQKGENYSDYVGSIVEGYVNKYKNVIEILGVPVVEARFITYEELIELGCNASNNSCSNAPDFIKKNSYWTGSAYSSDKLWVVVSGGNFVTQSFDSSLKMRPVIIISKDLVVYQNN